ncbi:MAG: hypothetical protein QW702_03570 [Candidatus Bathyarchaeia archaeon]
MNRFRNDRRGQFVILVAVIIAAFMFSLILSISQISTKRQEVSYEPVDETVLAITSDFERCLTRALAIASQQKYFEGDGNAIPEGEKLIESWVSSVLESYGGFGLNIEKGQTSWSLDYGISQVFSQLSVSIEKYGLKKLSVSLGKCVMLNIENVIIDRNSGNVKIEFQIFQSGEKGRRNEPIPNLTENSLWIKVNNTVVKNFTLSPYIGRGRYIVEFTSPIELDDEVTIITITIIAVTPEDNIVVSARRSIFYSVNESAPPQAADWSTLYLAKYITKKVIILSPEPSSGKDEFGTPPRSHGQSERVEIRSEKTPFEITLDHEIEIILFMEASKYKGKNFTILVTVSFGYYSSSGHYHQIGNEGIEVGKQKGGAPDIFYNLTFSVPDDIKIVPEGSVFELVIEARFIGGDGTLKIYFGGDTPSRIKLYTPH